jgi:trk system potassium uptake protein
VPTCASWPSTGKDPRADRQVICDGSTRIEAGDEVFVLAATSTSGRAGALRQRDEPVKRVMIAGGGKVGLRLARRSRARCSSRSSSQPKRCEYLATQLPSSALVLHGDSTDEDLLERRERAGHGPVPGADQRRRGQHHVLPAGQALGAQARAGADQPPAYADLVQGSTDRHRHLALADRDRRAAGHVRRGDVAAVHSLRRGAAEALEAIVRGDRKTSKVAGRRIEQMALPKPARRSAPSCAAAPPGQKAGQTCAARSSSRTTTP